MHPENPTITNQYIKLLFSYFGAGINISLILSSVYFSDILASQNLIAVSKVIQ